MTLQDLIDDINLTVTEIEDAGLSPDEVELTDDYVPQNVCVMLSPFNYLGRLVIHISVERE